MTETTAALVASPDADPPAGGGPQQAPEQTSTDPEAIPIAPDSLRVDQRVGAELFGANYIKEPAYDQSYTGNTSHGPATYGNDNTINQHNHFAPAPLRATFRRLTHVSHLGRWYVVSDVDRRLDLLLMDDAYRVVCLTGPRNSGRFSTACAALARKYAPDRVYEITLPPGGSAYALTDQRKELLPGHGYVLRLPGSGHIGVMRALGSVFLKCSSRLILIRDEGTQERELHRAEVRHGQPDPVEVFRRHLAWLLEPADNLPVTVREQVVDGYLQNEELRKELCHTYGPREVVIIAEAFGRHHPVSAGKLAEILSATQPRRRRRASRILLPQDAVPDRRHRAVQHERAFRIAYAVFQGQPLHYVFESADRLLTEIDGAALRPDWGSMVLRYPVSDLLGAELLGDWQKSWDAGGSASGTSRSALIHDGGLRGALLDVAWHDFDSTRGALLTWLDRLVQHGDDIMLRAAADTAAVLASHDFDLVHDVLIDGWAASPRHQVRQTAAWTERIAALNHHTGHRVRTKVREWCYGASNHRRDTAARVYASGLDQPDLNWSMQDLRRIAADAMQRRQYAVAEAINQLYTPERAAWLIAELTAWTESPDVRVHAARGLLAVAGKPAPYSADGSPDLLLRLVAGEVTARRIARVWRLALVHPSMTTSAWDTLATWLRHADQAPLYRPAVADLLRLLADDDRLRRRTSFYLKRMWKSPDGLPEWVQLVLKERT